MNKYLAFAIIFAILNAGLIFFIFGFQEYADTPQYIGLIHYFRGEGAEGVHPWRMLKPLAPLLAVPFEFLGEGAGLVVQNLIFYFLSALLIFKITELTYQNQRQAFFASVFFVTATPVIEVGISYLTDMGGWFFYLLSLFLTILYFKRKESRLITINGFLSGLGFLLKEPGGLGAPFFGLMVLFFRGWRLREKALKVVHFAIFFLLPVVIVQILVFKHFRGTLLDWYLFNMVGHETGSAGGVVLIILRYLGQFFRILGIIWPLVLIGLWRELIFKDWERRKIFLSLLPASFSFLLWTTGGGGRVAFIFAPLGIILASYGLEFFLQRLNKKTAVLASVAILLVLLSFNHYFAWVNKHVLFIEKIARFLGILR